MSLELYIAYLLACVVLVIVPGPTVTLIIANSLTHGSRAGLLNVAGTQLGLAVMITIVGIGLTSVIETMGWWFDWLRLAGAGYLVWLGWKLLRSAGNVEKPHSTPAPRGGFFLQGFFVLLSNPKSLLLFGAFIPQFIDPRADYLAQVLILGATAMLVALASDTAYAILTGRAGQLFSQRRVRLMSRISGVCLISGGVWLAVTRTR
jgi:homoserine/homoserine lactone efflux protein